MTAVRHRVIQAIGLCIVLVAFDQSVALAQSQVRVIRERATIWQRDSPVVVAAMVSRGTVLDVVDRQGDWYVVVIPSGSTAGTLGLIAASQVEVATEGRFQQPPRPPGSQRGEDSAPTPARSGTTSRAIEVFGFGQAGYGAWLAKDTFAAVLGSSNSPMFGGGVQARSGSLFIEVAAERFEKTGQRVFVNDGAVFKLGIADTVRVVPAFVTVGYRQQSRRLTGYGGAGIGRYAYKETSDFADPSENLDEHFRSYHVLAGLEVTSLQWLRTAVEVQYTTVPNALGTSGASAAFNEHNLGGIQLRLKILAGR
jgi:hypothetical protein